ALQDHKPGETIDVVVIRNDKPLKLRATLGTRGAPAPAPFEIKAGKPYEKTFDGEKHLKDIKQLTFGGENAEAYFSPDGKKLIFQSTREGHQCDQIYTMNIDGSDVKMVSNGDGRTTCSYFFPNGKRILYSSTRLGGRQCPPRPDFSHGYVW